MYGPLESHPCHERTKFPFQTSAPETIQLGTPPAYSEASDAFAFSIFLYQLFAGLVPYAEIPCGDDILQNVRDGQRMSLPTATEEFEVEIFRLISRCWPSNRPTGPLSAKFLTFYSL